MASAQSRRCPICDTELEDEAKACPNCGTDVTLFTAEDGDQKRAAIKGSKSLDELLASVMEDVEAEPEDPKGLDTLDDLDLELPDEPPDQPRLELEILEKDVLQREGREEGIAFECPGCGTEVDENATKCPSCGALFAEGEVFQCPVCNTSVPVSAEACPQCGVRFVDQGASISETTSRSGLVETLQTPALEPIEAVESAVGAGTGKLVKAILAQYDARRRQEAAAIANPRHLQKTLHRQVSELKSLISLARRLHVPVENTQRVIAEATKKARSRDLASAVRLAWGARLSMEQSVALQIAQRLEILQGDLKAKGGKRSPFPVAETLVEEAAHQLGEGRTGAAFEKLQLAMEDMASKSSGQGEARYALRAAEDLLKDVSSLGVPLAGVKELLGQGKAALRKGNWESASHLAAAVQEKATEAVRQGIAEEMKRARQQVMELKMQGRDVNDLVMLLKQASASVKEGGYAEAVEYLQLFKSQA